MRQPHEDPPIWVDPPKKGDWLEQIVKEFAIHPITAQVLVTRGFEELGDINHYLYAKLPDLHPPHLLETMETAVARICQAVEQKEGILICGDNDVDGMTGTALLTEFFRYIGAATYFYVPNRSSQRQSLLLEAAEYGAGYGCKLIVTVDCGITAAKEIEEVVKQGIEVIVTDHHEPTEKLPLCVATLNPKLLDSHYPNRDLTGVGVAFKLIHALTNYLTAAKKLPSAGVDLKRYLDLVALGTIADMGALRGENRILVRYGLAQLRKTKRIGLTKLFQVCDIERKELTASDMASKVAPRLNSLGRIADPRKGVELLLITDPVAAEAMAKELDLHNLQRQKIEQVVSEDVDQFLLEHPSVLSHKAIVLDADHWHPGVIAIVTARIAKQYNRPTILIAVENGIGKGSLRTIREFPLLPALKQVSDLLLNFGGHDYAAGLTIRPENIEEFRKRFLAIANSQLRDQDISSKLHLDALANFDDLNFEFMESLGLLEPFGNENPLPVFYCEARQVWPPKVVGNSHLKLYLEQNNRVLEGIGFGMGWRRPQLKGKDLRVRLAFSPHLNKFQNKISIQLLIRDFQVL